MDVDISTSSQWRTPSAMICADWWSLAVRFSTVWSEKTTPHPKVTPSAHYARTTAMSCAGVARLSPRWREFRPAPPAPMQAIFHRRGHEKSPESAAHARACGPARARDGT